ncbi:MAG TPA: FkbM family methyltransferase [Azospirillaceae bacterium]|nr:FkbM family methyltransferase [Azospirillaceae bacterium]
MESKDSHLHIHVIGSRGTGTALALPDRFAEDTIYYNYEPDADALGQTCEFYHERGLTERTFNIALGGYDGEAVLNLNYDPYTSSMLECSTEAAHYARHHDLPNGDYIWGDVLRTVRRPRVPVRRLDGLLAEHGARLDFMTLDTQGTEFDILQGAQQTCATTALGFLVEVEFLPLYERQKLFPDLLNLARSWGFALAEILPHREGAFRGAPIGWQGRGFIGSADALFLKHPEAVLQTHPDPWLGLRKLAFLSICYGRMEHGLDCLTHAEAVEPRSDPGPRSYLALTDDILSAWRSSSTVAQVRFTDLYSAEESLARFDTTAGAKRPAAIDVRRRYFNHQDRDEFDAAIAGLLKSAPSPVERILDRYGFGQIASALASNRRDKALETCLAIGFFAEPGNRIMDGARTLAGSLRGSMRVAFYGTGEVYGFARRLLPVRSEQVAGIVDGDPARLGMDVDGHKVRPPGDLPGMGAGILILCSLGSADRMADAARACGYGGKVFTFRQLLDLVCIAADGEFPSW